MKRTWIKILIAIVAVICLLVAGAYLGRGAIAKSYYGELESLDYYTGGGIAGYFEHYVITREGDSYSLTARVMGEENYDLTCPLGPTVTEDILAIITSENLYLRNGVDEVEENLYDGLGETLSAEFSGATLSYNYYGTSVYRNAALADYLLELTREASGQ